MIERNDDMEKLKNSSYSIFLLIAVFALVAVGVDKVFPHNPILVCAVGVLIGEIYMGWKLR
jgi:uncharacterized membrane protein YqjE